jgi:hypothetical protein
MPRRTTLVGGCVWAASGAMRRLRARVTMNPTVRRVMVASHMSRYVKAFYPPCAEQGNQILPMKSFTSAENVCGYTTSL